ncbi:PD-(D/E)XK nuclease family protein [Gudongella sp. DL1XJH-153]|uniref:PD-(D/E)XK nuclease family protein n=1 Tax=Gudongella sp. DL1XJH-153 TaxID=3409804 RepID=UPI003BB6A483
MKIIAGRAKSGKSTYIYDEIKKEMDSNPDGSCILIVPEVMTFRAESDIIEKFNDTGIMNIRILSFTRLVNTILEETGGSVLPDITLFGKLMLLKRVFDKNSDQLMLYKKVAGHQGLLVEFEKLIRELKESRITPEDLERVIQNTERSLTKKKLIDIKLLFREYNSLTKDNFQDEEDKLESAIEKVENSNLIRSSKIWIDGFESFDNQKLELIRALKEHARSVELTLNIDASYLDEDLAYEDFDVFKIISDTYHEMDRIFKDEIRVQPLQNGKSMKPEIEAIERNLFSLEPEKYGEETENIRIASAMNPYTEVEKVANVICSLVRDEDYRWKDIKIATSNLDSYSLDIKKVFGRYDIPYYMDERKDILSNAIVKSILFLMDMLTDNFSTETVFNYLKSGFSPLSGMDENNQPVPIELNHINEMENMALKYGMQGDKWFIDGNPQLSQVEEDFRKILAAEFEPGRQEFGRLQTVGEYSKFILDFLDHQDMHKKVANEVSAYEQDKMFEEASEMSQAWNSVMEVLEQMILIAEKEEVSVTEYRKILEAGLSEIRIRTIPPIIDSIEIGDVNNISVKESKVLFIMGMNEGVIGSTHEKGLLSDDDREEIIKTGVRISSGSVFQSYRDGHILYKLFTVPKDRLMVTYPLAGGSGDSLQPSLYISTLETIFPSLKEESDLWRRDKFEDVTLESITSGALIKNLRMFLKGGEIDPVWLAVYKWYEENNNEKAEEIIERLTYTKEIPKLDPETIKSRFDDKLSMTVSKLETYSECPFKYFVENILSPRERTIQKVEFYDIGNEYHDVLEEYIKRLIQETRDIMDMDMEDAEKLMKESIDEVRSRDSERKYTFASSSRNDYIQRKLERVLYRNARIIMTQIQRGKFRPRAVELRIGKFGRDNSDYEHIDPVTITVDGTPVELRGKIDRVDMYEDDKGDIYVTVIDYKSSSKALDLCFAYEGLQMQLLVYVNALVEKGDALLGRKPKIAGIYYHHVDDPIIDKDVKDLDQQILRKLKLKGYTLADGDMIRCIDERANGYGSDIIQAGIKQDGSVSSRSKTLTEDQFDDFLAYIDKKVHEISSNIINGDFEISPYSFENKQKACTYCDYGSICLYDESDGDKPRYIGRIDDETLIRRISDKGVSLDDGMD